MTPPDSARYAAQAAAAIGATFEDLDEGRGYLYRVSRNGRFILGGGGGVCAYPINSAPAFTIARDKAHTKSVLSDGDLPVIPGGLFFAHKRRVNMREPGRDIEDAVHYAERLGFPVFCKPNQGGRGNFAESIQSPEALADYAHRVAIEFESFLVEPVVTGIEHRVLVMDERPIAHIVKTAPTLTGDGRHTWDELLAAANEALAGSGVSAAPQSTLTASGVAPSAIPAAGQSIILAGRQNLHAAGNVEIVSDTAPPELARLAVSATRALDLRLGAVDIFDASPKRDLSKLLIIEVNGNPGLASLERAGRTDIIVSLWQAMLTECLED